MTTPDFKSLAAEPDHLPDARKMVEPDDLALRVQKLEALRETERAAVLDLYQQIDKLKARLDWQYTKIGRLEDASIKDLAEPVSLVDGELAELVDSLECEARNEEIYGNCAVITATELCRAVLARRRQP
jgi:hypothetical protein